jgi:hypothetical protein
MLPLRTISWHILEKYHATILTKYDTQKQFYKIELIHSATLYDADTLYLCLNPDELGKSLPMPKNACYVLSAFEFPAPFLTLQIAGQVDLL